MKLLHIALLDLKKEIKSPGRFIIMLMFPIFFTFIMGLAFGGNNKVTPMISVGIENNDQGVVGETIVKALKSNKNLRIVSMGAGQAQKDVKAKKVSCALVLPSGLTPQPGHNKKLEVQFVALPGNNDALAVKQVISVIIGQVETNLRAAEFIWSKAPQTMAASDKEGLWREAYLKTNDKWYPEPPVKVNTSELKAGKENKLNGPTGVAQTSMGFTITFVMFTIIFGAGAILEEREKGTLGRVLAAPVAKWEFLGGHLLGTYIIGLVQLLILVLAGQFLFHVDWGRNLPALLVLLSIYLFCITGLGTLIAGMVKTNSQLQAIGQVVITSMAMLGGAYWPLEIVPRGMQLAAKFVPTGWIMSGLKDIIARGAGIEAVWSPALILMAMGVGFFALGLRLVKFE